MPARLATILRMCRFLIHVYRSRVPTGSRSAHRAEPERSGSHFLRSIVISCIHTIFVLLLLHNFALSVR